MRTCCVVLPLVPLAVGDPVDRRAWMPHVTLVGDVRMPDGGTDAAGAVLRGLAAQAAPITMTVVQEARFGEDGSVLVDLVESPRLRVEHERALTALRTHVDGLEVVDPAWAGDGYRPHRSVVPGTRPSPGDHLDARDVALVELDPAGAPGRGVVLAVWELGAANGAAETTGADVLAVLGALHDAEVRAWVVGGWGVDALAGRRTRAHHDVDLLLGADRAEEAVEALAHLGFRIRFVWSENRWSGDSGRLVPSAFVAVDGAGREVDVHTIRIEAGLVAPLSVSSIDLPATALDAAGAIHGMPVPCASAAAQLVMHSGYDLPDRQRGDVALLARLVDREPQA